MPKWVATQSQHFSDEEYQDYILQGVSRTFALTIPQLPPALCKTVGNAYLLCRIADTIEDDNSLSAAQKREFSEKFINVISGQVSPDEFSKELLPRLSRYTNEAERDLIRNTARVIRITHSFTDNQRAAMSRCVGIMANGMSMFQENKYPHGLKDLAHLDRYCYYVAGVVGEMLTELYCEYSDDVKKNRERMMQLAVSFGQGLQMTNILKDIWDDKRRGACWLPQKVFQENGYDLKTLTNNHYSDSFGSGLEKLIAVAHAHLRNALAYTLLIPRREKGIRKFCFWALGMALLTLRKINKNRDFTAGSQVKISRRSVEATILATHLTGSSNKLPRLLFTLTAIGLPRPSSMSVQTFNGSARIRPPKSI